MTCRRTAARLAGLAALLASALLRPAALAASEQVFVEEGSALRWIANAADPGLGLTWTQEMFDDSTWAVGAFGIGYEVGGGGATNLITTSVPLGSYSVYARAAFIVADPASVTSLSLGADYDDGYVAWLNGVEIWRSEEMPAGALAWDTDADLHESSNGVDPFYGPYEDVTAAGLPMLHAGTNVLAIGSWNGNAPGSSDLVVVPRLVGNRGAFPITRGPWLQSASPTSMVIRWRSEVAETGRVLHGDAPGNLTTTTLEPLPSTEHAVTLAGLTPGTRYSYAVGNPTTIHAGDDASHWFVTPPLAGTRQAVRAWVLGDAGTKNADQAQVRDAYATFTGTVRTDAVILLGDNAYTNGTDADYQQAVFEMYPSFLRTAPTWPTYGNHDGRSADSTTQSGVYYDIFTLPTLGECGGLPSGTEAYYSFDLANIHFVCLDSYETSRLATDAMATWLAADLGSTSQDWLIAFWHHPPYTKGSHDSDAESELVEMRGEILPILENSGVDLVLSGHSHSYERTWLLDRHYGLSTSLAPQNILDGGDGRPASDGAYVKPTEGLAAHEGTVYVVAGSSGKTEAAPLDHPAMFVALEELGSVVLDVNGSRLDGTFLDERGALRDTFTIIKGLPQSTESDCLDGQDDDQDGDVDCADPDCLSSDVDGDLRGDCAGDCAPLDGGTWAVPLEVTRLILVRSGATDAALSWTDVAATSGPATTSEVLSGRLAALWTDRDLRGAACLAAGLAVPVVVDARLLGPPARGDGWWYLARARTACGAGPAGAMLPLDPCP